MIGRLRRRLFKRKLNKLISQVRSTPVPYKFYEVSPPFADAETRKSRRDDGLPDLNNACPKNEGE